MAVVYLSASVPERFLPIPPFDPKQYLALFKSSQEALRDYSCLFDLLLVIAGANLAGTVTK
jgi:hypothetical protein